jgi:hypothetical protein
MIELHPEWAERVILLSPASGVAEMDGAMHSREKAVLGFCPSSWPEA